MKITDKEKIQFYIDFMPFLRAVLGENAEIVIHDLSDEKKSVVAIENPLSDRKIGYPLTDLAKELVHRGTKENLEFIANYHAKSKGKHFVSYTFFIKNEGRTVGLLCINKDTKASDDVLEAISRLLGKNNLRLPAKNNLLETLDPSVEDFLTDKISAVIQREGVSVEHMSAMLKKKIVYALSDEEILKHKGAVSQTAEMLRISVPTLYRYLRERE